MNSSCKLRITVPQRGHIKESAWCTDQMKDVVELQRIKTPVRKEMGVTWLGETEEFACRVLGKFLKAARWYLHLHFIDQKLVHGHI